jgi:hypothetical protein
VGPTGKRETEYEEKRKKCRYSKAIMISAMTSGLPAESNAKFF